jgi:hypothetical protein
MPSCEEASRSFGPTAIDDRNVSIMGIKGGVIPHHGSTKCRGIKLHVKACEDPFTECYILADQGIEVLVAPNFFDDELEFLTHERLQVYYGPHWTGFLHPPINFGLAKDDDLFRRRLPAVQAKSTSDLQHL